jgi:hypothetical protein
VAGVVARRLKEPGGPHLGRVDRPLLLVAGLALAAPLGEALVSAVGPNLFGTRNLAVSWPGYALTLGALLVAPGPRLRLVTVPLVVAGFAIGAALMLEPRYERPDYDAAGAFIDRVAAPADVVVDGAAILVTPGPLSGLDLALDRPHRVYRLGVPQERDHPFNADDPILPTEEVMRRVARAAGGRRIFLVASRTRFFEPLIDQAIGELPRGYERVRARNYPGVTVWTVARR